MPRDRRRFRAEITIRDLDARSTWFKSEHPFDYVESTRGDWLVETMIEELGQAFADAVVTLVVTKKNQQQGPG